MIKNALKLLLAALLPLGSHAQLLEFSQPHGFYDSPFELQIVSVQGELPAGLTIRYTLDGSEPVTTSPKYNKPISVSGTTIVRAAVVADTGRVTMPVTATYLFVDDVLQQSNTPVGYPTTWGSYTEIQGTAKADYEMDPEMTGNATLRQKIAEGLQSLPVLSIVTDKDNLFSHENDPDRGGIYIFTGPPVGDNTGHGWTRPASIEMFTSTLNSQLSTLNPQLSTLNPQLSTLTPQPSTLTPQPSTLNSQPSTLTPQLSTLNPQLSTLNFSTTCGLRLHGGHGRLAEKNPKHSFRLVFKEQYGPKSLKYPLFGDDEPDKFDQLVLRCHFGNTWQHWSEGNREKAQYTRDVWSRRMQRKMGHTAVNALYVNLFLNGMYWGLYNIAERVDDQFGKNHLGGKKSDIDVVKIEEDGGNHIEASEGDLTAWNEMVETAARAYDDAYYQKLDTLLDISQFIDYMLINQYGGNTDWDHHNWYAVRRRGTDSEGFRFLCWDSEIILENNNENVFGKNNGNAYPTGIFQNLLLNPQFARRYLRRAKEVLAPDGLLGQESVVAVWDSLFNTIHAAVYAEAARWGDYRRDVHRWQSAGKLYTVDNTYMTERNRLLTQYFPVRSERVLNSIVSAVNIDDFEAPAGWIPLTATMFRAWDGSGADAQPLDTPVSVDWQMGVNVGGGGAVAGFVGVEYNHFADISQYDKLVLRGSGSGLRILANRLVDHGPWKQIVVSFNSSDPYWDSTLQAIVIPLEDLRTMPDTNGADRVDDFVHLNALKVDWSSSIKLLSAHLTPFDVALAGDADGNGVVNVTDVTCTINHILGRTPDGFNAAAADVNGDGTVNVSDVTGIINIVLGK